MPSRPFILLCACSVLLSLALLWIGYKPSYGEYRGGYALLTLDKTANDREIIEILAGENGKFKGPLHSESTEWVMLDEFGSVATIPLDEYAGRLYPFDPRNDGYADKLKNFFVDSDNRFIFIPMQPYNSTALFSDFDEILPGISHSLDYMGFEKPVKTYLIIFSIAAFALLVICCIQRKTGPSFFFFFPSLAVIVVCSCYGPWGFALAAVAVGLIAQLREPVSEIFAIQRANYREKGEKFKRIKRDVIRPNRIVFFGAILFILAAGLIIYISGTDTLFLSAVFVLFLAVFALSCRTFSVSGAEHMRFKPILIAKRRVPDTAFSLYMLPFAIAVVVSIFLSPKIPTRYNPNTASMLSSFAEKAITAADYQRHVEYQAYFSWRPLNGVLNLGNSLYPSYIAAGDGLLSPAGSAVAEEIQDVFPPFPLQQLMDFITGIEIPTADGVIQKENYEYLALPLLLVLIVPALILKNGDFSPKRKRISALAKKYNTGGRWGDKKRKKVLLYINENSKMIRKDA